METRARPYARHLRGRCHACGTWRFFLVVCGRAVAGGLVDRRIVAVALGRSPWVQRYGPSVFLRRRACRAARTQEHPKPGPAPSLARLATCSSFYASASSIDGFVFTSVGLDGLGRRWYPQVMAQRVVFDRRTPTLESSTSIHTAKLGGSASSLFRICPRTRFSVWREGSPNATERLRGLLFSKLIFTARILPKFDAGPAK